MKIQKYLKVCLLKLASYFLKYQNFVLSIFPSRTFLFQNHPLQAFLVFFVSKWSFNLVSALTPPPLVLVDTAIFFTCTCFFNQKNIRFVFLSLTDILSKNFTNIFCIFLNPQSTRVFYKQKVKYPRSKLVVIGRGWFFQGINIL